jgi:hypothetical protein
MQTFQPPPISGNESEVLALARSCKPVFAPTSNLVFSEIKAAFCCALHMHQPTIPAGKNGALISHLQYMFDHPSEGDNHNAESFTNCYKRLAEIIPELIGAGFNPRIMLDYSGNLLWGFEQMGRVDILNALKSLICDPKLQPHVEWLGTFWSHAVAPSTPIPDLKLQIMAWQHHFAALFGDAALQRVKGFSPPEMHLPNHPDTLFEFVKALKESGYRWLLVQEHSVENFDASCLSQSQKYIPNRLIARNLKGDSVSITALIKTQGSDTKLVGQMQPCYEAFGLGKQLIGNIRVPALVSQIADGENGGVMMNEFPQAFKQAYRQLAGESSTVAINGTEYLEFLDAAGVQEDSFPVIQAVHQHKIWQQIDNHLPPDTSLMLGASWTNNLSWVEGYENVLEPINQLSAKFHKIYDPMVANNPAITKTPHYQNALLHLLLLQTSCFRYWGQGSWTEYAKEIYRAGDLMLNSTANSCASNI